MTAVEFFASNPPAEAAAGAVAHNGAKLAGTRWAGGKQHRRMPPRPQGSSSELLDQLRASVWQQMEDDPDLHF